MSEDFDAEAFGQAVAVVTEANDLGGVPLSPAVAAAMREASSALAAAGYEIVDEHTPGFARAFDLWFEMLIPEFRRFMHADFERDGDEGIRTAMRFVLDNVPESDADARRSPMIRSRISVAAFLVNVIARIFAGSTPALSRLI